jgi:hypothetical protein
MSINIQDFHIKMQDLIINHIKYDNAKLKWLEDLINYSKKYIEIKGHQIIGQCTTYEGKTFFTVSREIHGLLFLSNKQLYDRYWKTFLEIANINKNKSISEEYARNKAREFIKNLAEVLCAASLSEEDIDAIYSSNFFKDSNETSSLRINFETLKIEDVYKRWQILENKVQHVTQTGKNRYSEPHEFCFICETEGEFMYVAIFV